MRIVFTVPVQAAFNIRCTQGEGVLPSDSIVTDAMGTFDVEGIQVVWFKALARRLMDPEGAITVARTLLGVVCAAVRRV